MGIQVHIYICTKQNKRKIITKTNQKKVVMNLSINHFFLFDNVVLLRQMVLRAI